MIVETPKVLEYESRLPGDMQSARATHSDRVTWMLVVVLIVVSVALAKLVSPIAAGIVYAVSFLLLTWNKPAIALALLFASIPIQNDISGDGAAGGFRFSIAEINLALCIPLWLGGRQLPGYRKRATMFILAIMFYFIVGMISSMGHWHGTEALNSFLQMAVFMVLAVSVVATIATDKSHYITALLTLLYVCALLGFATTFVGSGYFGGMHKNGMGSSLACGVVVGTELLLNRKLAISRTKVLFALMICIVGLIVSVSRGAWLSAIVGLTIVVFIRSETRLISRLLIYGLPLVLVGIAIGWYLLPADKRRYALIWDDTGYSIKAREENKALFKQFFSESPVLGVGVGMRKKLDATNIVFVTLAETGVVGLAAFLWIQISMVLMMLQLRRRVLPTDPAFSFVVLGVALVMGRFVHGLFDHYWSRGVLMAAWACVGMMVRLYGEVFSTKHILTGNATISTYRPGRSK